MLQDSDVWVPASFEVIAELRKGTLMELELALVQALDYKLHVCADEFSAYRTLLGGQFPNPRRRRSIGPPEIYGARGSSSSL